MSRGVGNSICDQDYQNILIAHDFDFLARKHSITGNPGFLIAIVGFFKPGTHIAILNVKSKMLYGNIKYYHLFHYDAYHF